MKIERKFADFKRHETRFKRYTRKGVIAFLIYKRWDRNRGNVPNFVKRKHFAIERNELNICKTSWKKGMTVSVSKRILPNGSQSYIHFSDISQFQQSPIAVFAFEMKNCFYQNFLWVKDLVEIYMLEMFLKPLCDLEDVSQCR